MAPFQVELINGARTKVDKPLSDAYIDKHVTEGSYNLLQKSFDVSVSESSRDVPIGINTLGDEAYIEGIQDIWTSHDQSYTEYIDAVRTYRTMGEVEVVPTRATVLVKNNPRYPTNNEAHLFWLASRYHGDDKQVGDSWFFEFAGDWFMEMGENNYAPMGSAQAKKNMARGLWPEEIIAGKTKEGVPLSELGWGDPSNIPWKNVLIGRRDPAQHKKDLDAMWDKTTGQPREGWQNTVLGQALHRMSIDPSTIVPGIKKPDGSDLTMWDVFNRRQGEIRHFMTSVRGNELARSDRWSHDIERLDSNADNDYKFIDGWSGPSPGKSKGRGQDYRIYNNTYRVGNERTRRVRKEFEALRKQYTTGGK